MCKEEKYVAKRLGSMQALTPPLCQTALLPKICFFPAVSLSSTTRTHERV